VIVSGWQVYDNKGRVVEKYEPFFAVGLDYVAPSDAQMGQKATMFYDPRGQVIRTLNPDGSEQRVIYGIPEDLANPEQFAPTPWEAYTYDAATANVRSSSRPTIVCSDRSASGRGMMPAVRSPCANGWSMATREIQPRPRRSARQCEPETCWGNSIATMTKPGSPR